MTDEYIAAYRELWTSDNPTFSGKYCSFSNIIFLPKPVQKPAIPIWIGGHSKQAIRRAARLGDGWHPSAACRRFRSNPRTLPRICRCWGNMPKRRDATRKNPRRSERLALR